MEKVVLTEILLHTALHGWKEHFAKLVGGEDGEPRAE